MAGKSILKPYKIVNAETMGGSVTSGAIPIDRLDNVGIQLQWTGTPTGDFYVDGRVHDDAPWTELTLSTAVAAAGSASDALINLSGVPYQDLRLRYVRTSGTGSLNAWATAKQLGG